MSDETHQEDRLLLKAAAGGDTNAITQIVERHRQMVYGTCLRILGNQADAEDAAQATFLVFLKKCRRIRRRTVLGGWLYRTAALVSREHIRAVSKRKKREKEAQAMRDLTHESSDRVWEELRPEIDKALVSLSVRYRDVLVLTYFEGRTGAETAATLGISETSVTTRLARAREKLRNCFLRRGITVSAVLLPVLLAEKAGAAVVPATIVPSVLSVVKGGFAAKGVATAAISAKAYVMAKGGLMKMFWNKIRAICATTIIAASAVGLGTTLMTKELAQTLDLNEEQLREADRIFQAYYEEYLALENKHTTIHQDEKNHVALTIDPFPEALSDLKERFGHEFDAILDKRQRAVARRHIPTEYLFEYGEQKLDLDISYDGKKYTVKYAAPHYSGQSSIEGTNSSFFLHREYERFWGDRKLAKPVIPLTVRVAYRNIRPKEECLRFESGNPVLTSDFAQTLDLAPEQVEKANEIFRSVFREYLPIERKHIKKTTDDQGTVHVTVSPFRRKRKAIIKRMWSELGKVFDERQMAVTRRLFPCREGSTPIPFPYGDWHYNIEIKQRRANSNRLLYDVEYDGARQRILGIPMGNCSGSLSCVELPEKYARLLE